MVFESLAPHELCQIICNQVTICWGKYQSKFRFSSLLHSLNMFYCHPSIKINEVILLVNNMTLKTMRSGIIVSPLHVGTNINLNFALACCHIPWACFIVTPALRLMKLCWWLTTWRWKLCAAVSLQVPYMLLQISGPGLIHFMIRCIKAEAFRRGFQKSTAVVPFSQGFVFFSIISSRLSQQYVQMQGGPIICTIQGLLSTSAIASR